MKLVKVQPTPPQALRILVQGADDAGPIDFALSLASSWGERPLLVVNASGKDLHAFGERFNLVEVQDDQGRPSRSLTEIIEVLEQVEPGTFEAAVILDTNRLYRAVRCAVRDAKEIENLSAGHWDSTNETLGLLGETLTRVGMPAIFVAPPTDLYGVDEHGDPTIRGSKAQGWKDLPRTSHLHLCLFRRGADLLVEVAGDDWGCLGTPGTVLEGFTGGMVGAQTSALAHGARAGETGGTTLAESSAAEIAARARRVQQRRLKSAMIRTRLLNIAELRAYQGRWDDLTNEISSSLASLEPADLNEISKRTDQISTRWSNTIAWMVAAERDLELSTIPLYQQRPGGICGPSPLACPTEEMVDVESLAMPDAAQHQLRDSTREQLTVWISSLARYAEVWDETPFAVVCAFAGVGCFGPSWTNYADDTLLAIAIQCLSLALAKRQFDHNTVPEPRQLQVVASEPAEEPKTSVAPLVVIAGRTKRVEVVEPPTLSVRLPTEAEFGELTRERAADVINLVLNQCSLRGSLDAVLADARCSPRKPHSPHTWNRLEQVAVYSVLLVAQRKAG